MRLSIKGLSEIRDRLERLRADEIMAAALAEQAERMAQAVRSRLSQPPDAGPHDRPWFRTGALRESIDSVANGLQAVDGSNDPAAAPQELGTSRIPPRPFFGPVAAELGEDVAQAIAEAVVGALREAPGDGSIIHVGTSRRSSAPPRLFDPLGVFTPGSPENELWARETMRLLRDIGSIFRAEQQEPEPREPGQSEPLPALPANPDDLLQQGWEEISHANAAAAGH